MYMLFLTSKKKRESIYAPSLLRLKDGDKFVVLPPFLFGSVTKLGKSVCRLWFGTGIWFVGEVFDVSIARISVHISY